jgi:hypothetical protein
MAGMAAKVLGFPIWEFPADWDTHGRSAGPLRNRKMLDTKPDLVIAFHGNLNASKGTKNMVHQARRNGVETEIITGRKKDA